VAAVLVEIQSETVVVVVVVEVSERKKMPIY